MVEVAFFKYIACRG